MKMRATLIVALVIAGLVATVLLANVIYANDAYDSGYRYGCYDSDFRYPADRYINQPGKGPSYHTETFLISYLNGFSVCNDKGYQSTSGFPELEEGQRWGTCEDKGGDIGLVCDIIDESACAYDDDSECDIEQTACAYDADSVCDAVKADFLDSCGWRHEMTVLLVCEIEVPDYEEDRK